MSIDFDGNTNDIGVGNDSSLNLNTINGFSHRALVKFSALGEREQILVKGNSNFAAPSTYDYFLGKLNTDEIVFRVSDGTSHIVFATTVTTPITSTSSWYDIVGTWDGTTDANGVKIYVNANLEGQFQATDTIDQMTVSHSLNIGGEGSQSFSMEGLIEEVILYDQVLTPENVAQLYNSRLKGMGDQILPDDRAIDLRMNDGPIGSSSNGITIKDYSSNDNDGIGNGGVFIGGRLSYSGGPMFPFVQAVVVDDIIINLFQGPNLGADLFDGAFM